MQLTNKKIIFLKSMILAEKSTEEFALDALNNEKYDNYPNYINKKEIEKTFDQYWDKLNPFNSEIYTDSYSIAPNVEGHFLSQNLPDSVESIVVDELCTPELISKYLDKHDDITHVGLSVYAKRMDKSLENISLITKYYPDKVLYLGGIGVLYPHIQNLVNDKIINRENVCFQGNGVNWLRNKMGFNSIKSIDFKIPRIISSISGFPKLFHSEYLVTQVGCPLKCDFCITNAFLQYNPFCHKPEKIIEHLNLIRRSYDNDIFILVSDPNSFFPEKIWKEVFDHFSKPEVKKESDNFIHFIAAASLAHLNNFDIEKIQKNCCLKILMVNFGMESTLEGGYKKNLGITNELINKMKKNGVSPNQNFILGLPVHTKDNISVEIRNNLKYKSDWFLINTFKPLAGTPLYGTIKNDGRLFGLDLPPEFLYQDGFFPFNHKNLGGGFSILKYAFEAYIECEKVNSDIYSNFAITFSNSPAFEESPSLKAMVKTFEALSEQNKLLYEARMV